jgi:DNA replication protein DnaC
MAVMADAFLEMQSNSTAGDLSREDWLGLLLDREVTARDNKRLGRRLSHARLRQSAVVEDTDFRTPRGLDRALFHKLAGCNWIRHSQHLVIGGPTGTGKSWLACALGTRPAGKASRCCIGARRGCSRNSRPPVARAGSHACRQRWSAPGC